MKKEIYFLKMLTIYVSWLFHQWRIFQFIIAVGHFIGDTKANVTNIRSASSNPSKFLLNFIGPIFFLMFTILVRVGLCNIYAFHPLLNCSLGCIIQSKTSVQKNYGVIVELHNCHSCHRKTC